MYTFDAMGKNPHHGSSLNEWLAEEDAREPGFVRSLDEAVAREELAATIRKARLGADLSQAQLAEKIGTTQSAIARAESGSVMPSTELMLKVGAAVGARGFLVRFLWEHVKGQQARDAREKKMRARIPRNAAATPTRTRRMKGERPAKH